MFYSIWSSNANTYRHFASELGHPPDIDSIQDIAKYDDILINFRRANPKTKIYGGHSQNVPPVTIFGFQKLTALNHLRLLRVMTDVKLGQRLLNCEYLEDAAIVLKTIPTMGPYIGLCALLNLSQCELFSWKEGGWASAGPGAVHTLKYIFGDGMSDYGTNFDLQVAGMQWIRNNQDLYWDALGISKEDRPQCPVGASNFKWDDHGYAAPVSRGGKALRVLDIENGACHFKRYRDRRAAGRIKWPTDHQDAPQQTDGSEVKDDPESEDELDELDDLDSERHRADDDAQAVVTSAADTRVKYEVADDEEKNTPPTSSSSTSDSPDRFQSFDSAASSPLTSRSSTPDLRDRDIYEVEKIIDKKGHLYRIRWKGWAPEWDEWRTEDDLADCPEILDEYDEYQYKVKAAIRKLQVEAKTARQERGEKGRAVPLIRVQKLKKRVQENMKKRSPSPTVDEPVTQRVKVDLDEDTKRILATLPRSPGGVRRIAPIVDLEDSDDDNSVVFSPRHNNVSSDDEKEVVFCSGPNTRLTRSTGQLPIK